MKLLITFLLASALAFAQTPTKPLDAPAYQLGPGSAMDLSQGAQTIPNRFSATDPACTTVGETYFSTTALVVKTCTVAGPVGTAVWYAPPTAIQPPLVVTAPPVGTNCTVANAAQIYNGVLYACSGGTYQFYGAVVLQSSPVQGASCVGFVNPPLIQDNLGNLYSCQNGTSYQTIGQFTTLSNSVKSPQWGAKGDLRYNGTGEDGAMTSGSAVITSNNILFTQADVGKTAVVIGAGLLTGGGTGTIATAIYQGLGAFTGVAGNTCVVNSGFSGNLTNAVVIYTLTGTNALANGTVGNVVQKGTGAISPSNSATFSNGSAVCTGSVSQLATLGRLRLISQIVSVSGNTATLATVANATVANARVFVCTDDTNAINNAIASGMKDVYIPAGTYCSTGITRGSTTTAIGSQRIHGDGPAENYANGSAIYYIGPQNGTVYQEWGCKQCELTGITFDGGDWAGRGVLITGNNAVSSSHRNIYHNLTTVDINGYPGIGYHVSGNYYAANQDVCCSRWTNINVYPGIVKASGGLVQGAVVNGMVQDGTQTVDQEFDNLSFNGYVNYGIDIVQGDARMKHLSFSGAVGAVDEVRFEDTSLWGTIVESYSEVHDNSMGAARHCFNAPTGTTRLYPTVLIGYRCRWFVATTAAVPVFNPIYFGSPGGLTITGSTVDSTIGLGNNIYIGNTASATLLANFFPPASVTITGPCVTDIVGVTCNSGLVTGPGQEYVKTLYSSFNPNDCVASYAGDPSFPLCPNPADANALTAFASQYTVPGNTLTAANATLHMHQYWMNSSSSTAQPVTVRWELNGTQVQTLSVANPVTNSSRRSWGSLMEIANGGTPTTAYVLPAYFNIPASLQTYGSTVSAPGNLSTSLANPQVLNTWVNFTAQGASTHTGTYTYASGSSACTNGVQLATSTGGGCTQAATANITITGGIPTGTLTTVTTGQGCTTLPTVWTIATCTGSGTFTTSGTLGGVMGNALWLLGTVITADVY
jgi:hypothetical protein